MKTPVRHSRVKNAIIFFAKNTAAAGKIELFHLLYLLDFEHFSQTGRSVTGMNYLASRCGPVPLELTLSEEEMSPGLADAAKFIATPEGGPALAVTLSDDIEFDDETFTPRQIGILDTLRTRYRGHIDITPDANSAWAKIWRQGEGELLPIPYELAIAKNARNRISVLESALEARGVALPADAGEY